jgi:hypothetical protein
MRRIALALAALVLVAFGLTACGSDDSSGNVAGPGQATTQTAFTCPSDNTKAFAKTRFVADLGIIFGTFHHFIYKPYQEGKFKQSGAKKVITIAKTAAAAAVIAKFSANAVDNVKASPTLCKAVGAPLSKANDLIQGLGDRIKSGDFSTIATLEGLVGTVTGLMSKHGAPVTETVQGS